MPLIQASDYFIFVCNFVNVGYFLNAADVLLCHGIYISLFHRFSHFVLLLEWLDSNLLGSVRAGSNAAACVQLELCEISDLL